MGELRSFVTVFLSLADLKPSIELRRSPRPAVLGGGVKAGGGGAAGGAGGGGGGLDIVASFFSHSSCCCGLNKSMTKKRTAIGVLILSTRSLFPSRFALLAIPFFSFVAFKRARKRESERRDEAGEKKKKRSGESERRFVCLSLLDLLLSA